MLSAPAGCMRYRYPTPRAGETRETRCTGCCESRERGDRAVTARVGGPVVTVSAQYGTAGAVIGPAVAEQLGVPFLDRAIPAAVAHSLSVPLAQVLEHDERRPGVIE